MTLQIQCLLTTVLIHSIYTFNVRRNEDLVSDIKSLDNKTISHLKFDKIRRMCDAKVKICSLNYSKVCAMRMNEGHEEYKVFENSCFLFMSNLCQYSDNEFYIVTSGSCKEYLNARRSNENTTKALFPTTTLKNEMLQANGSSEYETDNSTESAITDPVTEETTLSTLYEIEEAYDGHKCPHSCTNEYKPICLNVNFDAMLYFKMYYFINHCKGDIYYCKNWREFQPPPNAPEETVRDSPLDWAYCASFKSKPSLQCLLVLYVLHKAIVYFTEHEVKNDRRLFVRTQTVGFRTFT